MTITELAERLNVSRQTVYNWIEKGMPHEVKYHGLRSETKLDFDEVILWINEQKRKGRNE